MTRILFTDLDGTLLQFHSYSAGPARPALEMLRRLGIPVVFCTSKTRAEVEYWRHKLDNAEPFIVENGGAVYIPANYFPFPVPGSRRSGSYDVVELGTPYSELVETLREASAESGCEVRGFHDMSVAEIAVRTGLPVGQSELAKKREYDEPFEILGPRGSSCLLEAIESRGKHWTRGDCFHHITGHNSKAEAVRVLALLYRNAFGNLATIGAGSGQNDVAFLRTVDLPIIIQSRCAPELSKILPDAVVTKHPGPQGWNDAVLDALSPGLVEAAGQGH